MSLGLHNINTGLCLGKHHGLGRTIKPFTTFNTYRNYISGSESRRLSAPICCGGGGNTGGFSAQVVQLADELLDQSVGQSRIRDSLTRDSFTVSQLEKCNPTVK